MLCFISSLSAKWHPSGDQKDDSWGRLNQYCREDEGKQSAILLQLPPLCPDWCAVWHCLAGRVLTSYYCLPQPFKFIVLTSSISAHFALNWLWHLSPRVILNQYIKLALVCCHCRSRSATVAIVSSALFTALWTTDPRCNWANIYGILICMLLRHVVNLCQTGAFHSKKFNWLCLPVMHARNIPLFAQLLCWTLMTDWSSDYCGGAGQCHYLVGKARNYLVPHLKEKNRRCHCLYCCCHFVTSQKTMVLILTIEGTSWLI